MERRQMTSVQSHHAEADRENPVPPLPADDVLRDSLKHCRRITRRQAGNFYYGLRLMPEPKRSAMYAIYAFLRTCDDLADDTFDAGDEASKLERIEQFRHRMNQVLDCGHGGRLPMDPIWPALRYVTAQFPIDRAHLHDMLDGQRCDLMKNRYQTFNELYGYCFKVASVVGLVCVNVWGHDGSADLLHMAEERGIAFQLTNILRDLVEDARRGRIYLPADELGRFGFDPPAFLKLLIEGRADERFDRLMAFQVERARDYYRRSAALDYHISPSCRPASWAIMRIYGCLLDRIDSRPRRVLMERVRLSWFQKSTVAVQATLWRGLRR